MHQIVLLTALTATSGLFGGGRQCSTGRCGYPTQGYAMYAPTVGCQPGSACGYAAAPAVAAPQAPVAAPAPAPVAPQAPAPVAAPAAPRAAYYYPSYYYSAAPTCAGGTCYRR